MNWILTSLLVLYVGVFILENVQTAEISIPSPPPLKIDKHLRKALLKALEKLDEEDPNSSDTRESRENSNDEELLDTSTEKEEETDKFSDKLPITVKEEEDEEEINADIFIHSVSTPVSHEKDIDLSKKSENLRNNEINLARSVNKETNGKQVFNKLNEVPTGTPVTVGSNAFYSLNSIPNSFSITRSRSNSSQPTTTPTPEDEDVTNVKVEDVQFIHAPLVAAFTVQQDDKGLPQKVIPHFGSKTSQTKTQNVKQTFSSQVRTLEEQQRSLEQQIYFLQQQRQQEELRLKQQQELQNQFVQKQNFNNQFQEQQLPAQNNVVRFNVQQSFDDRRNQQLPIQQNPAAFTQTNQVKIQKAQSVPVQNIQSQQQNVAVQQSIQPNLQIQGLPLQQSAQFQPNVFNTEATKQQNTIVGSPQTITIQPSLSFQPSRFTSGIVPNGQIQYSDLHFTGQQPPIKEAVNFQQNPSIPFFTRNNIFSQQQAPLQFTQHTFNNNFLQDINLRTQLPPHLPNQQSIRVFRQESQTGNFGVNDFRYQNQFSNQPTRSNNVNFVRSFEPRPAVSSFGHNQFNIDKRLKNLFYQSGFGQGRSQEDFNIVSKVLALDHSR